MMREILFRGKRVDNGEWVDGSVVHQTQYYGDTVDRYHIIYDGEFDYDYYSSARVIPETVGQYTGFTDKNGTKIFEGDIVKAEINGGPYDKFVFPVGVIAFENGDFGNKDRKQFTPLSSYAPRVSFEVIGTIHDNPELLKGESDNA